MKKFYSFMLLAILSIVGLSASAFNLTVKANPEHISQIMAGSNTDKTAMSFSEEGVENSFEFSGSYLYITITPKTNVKMTVIAKKADGTETTLKNGVTVSTPQTMFTMASNCSDGELIVTTEEQEPDFVWVDIDGNAADVIMKIQGKTVDGLTEGRNKVPLTNRIVSFEAADGTQFYKLTYNGVEKAASWSGGEGSSTGSWSYTFTSTKSGDVFYINTQAPDENLKVNILSNYPEFITRVTVAGTPVSDWESFEVPYGKELILKANYGDYQVNSILINGEAPAGFSGSYSTFVREDITIEFDVTPIVRNNEITVTVPADLSLSVANRFNYVRKYGSGDTYTVTYSDVELPLLIYTDYTGSSELKKDRFVEINGKVFAAGFSTLTLKAEDIQNGDALNFYLGTPYFTVNTNDAEHLKMTLYGAVTDVVEGTEYTIKADQNPNRVVFEATEGYVISKICINDVEQELSQDGIYSFIPQVIAVYDVTVSEYVEPTPELPAEYFTQEEAIAALRTKLADAAQFIADEYPALNDEDAYNQINNSINGLQQDLATAADNFFATGTFEGVAEEAIQGVAQAIEAYRDDVVAKADAIFALVEADSAKIDALRDKLDEVEQTEENTEAYEAVEAQIDQLEQDCLTAMQEAYNETGEYTSPVTEEAVKAIEDAIEALKAEPEDPNENPTETGIDAIAADKDVKVYNLQGVQVSAENLPAGMYIVNGKKVVIRK